MAPKRKQGHANDEPKVAVSVTIRVTRNSARLANVVPTQPAAEPERPKTKKAKVAVSKGKETASPPAPPSASVEKALGASKTVVIEHCKQCNSFKTRAIQVKEGLEKGVPGVIVSVNPEKPRRGCFEIREGDGEIFVSLLDLKRPFSKMKALDMNKVISDIVEKIK